MKRAAASAPVVHPRISARHLPHESLLCAPPQTHLFHSGSSNSSETTGLGGSKFKLGTQHCVKTRDWQLLSPSIFHNLNHDYPTRCVLITSSVPRHTHTRRTPTI